MADKSKIEWTDASWTPIRARNLTTGKVGWHCEHATTGCEFCYAEGMNKRLGTGLPFKPGHRKDIEIFLDEEMMLAPLRWKKPRMIFVCSMTDLFADFVTDEWIDKIFAVMALCPQHTFQVLTKRAERMHSYLSGLQDTCARDDRIGALIRRVSSDDDACLKIRWPLRNVWLGVSAERQQEADERIERLLITPAAVRFLSCEPLIGPIDLTAYTEIGPLSFLKRHNIQNDELTNRVDWVIVGGEQWGEWASGYRFRMGDGDMVFRQFTSFEQWVNKASGWVNGGICLDAHGQELKNGAAFMKARDESKFPVTIMHRVGKKSAGRLLDGEEHNGFPNAEVAFA